MQSQQTVLLLLSLAATAVSTAVGSPSQNTPPTRVSQDPPPDCGCSLPWNTDIPPGGSLGYCSASQIVSMNIQPSTCICRDKDQHPVCPTITCPACPGGFDALKTTKYCTGGCQDREAPCKGCELFFHSVCLCLQYGSNCDRYDSVSPGGAPIWMKLTKGSEPLITTNKMWSGILEMEQPANLKFADEGWVHAQDHFSPPADALVVNSYRARKFEQVHIHVCGRKNHTFVKLTDETPKSSTKLMRTSFDDDLWCLALKQKNGIIRHFATVVRAWMDEHYKELCYNGIGAGIMRDYHGRTWACATSGTEGPIGTFCENSM